VLSVNKEAEFAKRRFGAEIDLGPCAVGTNLNLLSFRGFARLDALSCASAPDVYDQVRNPSGTQRDLNAKHARDCFDYSMGAVETDPTDYPYAFPEVLFNVRDTNVVEVYDLDDPETTLDIDSFSEPPISGMVGIRIKLDEIEFPKRLIGPQISRVDGNHRLQEAGAMISRAAEDGEDIDAEFPVIPFSMLISLDTKPEARLFRDINGTPIKMETAHLDTIQIKTVSDELIKADNLPLWLANQLAKSGFAFHNKVFYGGSKAGVKEQLGGLPPLNINSLKVTIKAQLGAAPAASTRFEGKPDLLLELLNRYWTAVALVWPEAWANKRDFILLQAIGLGGFARLGGMLLDRSLAVKDVSEAYFARTLEVVSERVPLERDNPRWSGVAGAGGQAAVAGALIDAADSEEAELKDLEIALGRVDSSDKDKLDEALENQVGPPPAEDKGDAPPDT